MRLPRRLSDILKEKQLLIDRSRDKLDNSIIRLQSKLFEQTIADLVPMLDVKDGLIQDTANNYQVISQIDKIYNDFNKIVISETVPQIIKGIDLIATASNNYFNIAMGGDIPVRFDKILEGTKKLIDLRLGISGGNPVRGGNLLSILKETGATDFKQLVSKAVTSQMRTKDFITAVKEKLVGGEKKYGSLQRQVQRFAYDIYQQYDAAYNVKLAEELGLTWFIYQGGLVEDSRDFCREHNNHVYSIEESEYWKTWTPADAVFITEFDQKDLNKVPSYLDYPGYDPLVDRGGYNCRHSLGFLSEGLAKKMREGEIRT
jgi:hypothetical protein